MTVTDPAALCDRALEAAASHGEALASATAGTTALTRFANSAIHQNVAEDATSLFVKVVVDGRVAGGSTTDVSDEGVRRLVDRVAEAARLRPPDPDWPGMAPAAPAPGVEHWDDETAAADPAARAEVVRAFVDAGDGLEAAGFCSTVATVSALATTAGQRVTSRATVATLDGMHRRGTAEGVAHRSSVRLADLDGEVEGLRSSSKARAGERAIDVEPGQYEVVLEPRCLASMLTFIALYGFNAKAVADGMSFARLGDAQFDPTVTITDDATDPASAGVVYDMDGTPKGRVDLVNGGVTCGLAHDRRTAGRAGTTSTGHASGVDSMGPIAANLLMAPGSVATDELVRGVERGLLVSSFHYTRVLDPRTLVVTGLTRGGVFLIEDGTVGPAVSNLRFTQSYVGALGPGRVLGLSADRTMVRSDLGAMTTVVPTARLAAWNFTGGAAG